MLSCLNTPPSPGRDHIQIFKPKIEKKKDWSFDGRVCFPPLILEFMIGSLHPHHLTISPSHHSPQNDTISHSSPPSPSECNRLREHP